MLQPKADDGVGPNCRVLMANGKWKVSKAARPKALPAPRELTHLERMIDRAINPLNGMKRF